MLCCDYEDFTVEKTEDGRLRIQTARPGDCRLFWSRSPDGFCDDNDLGSFRGMTIVQDPVPDGRCYFHILCNGRYSVAAQKLWMVDGLDNFRELGGYNTADGRSFVRFGQLYRSNRLCGIHERGKRQLQQLGIRKVVDFRVPVEIRGHEDPPMPGSDYLHLMPSPQNSQCFHMGFEEMLSADTATILSMRDALREHYRELPFGSEAYREFFARLKKQETPLIFHCTAGKDRTGVAAALILLGLGVPKAAIVYDYMLTCTARAKEIKTVIDQVRAKIHDEQVLGTLGMFMSVEQSSIEDTLGAIERRSGEDIPAYFERELDVKPDELENLKKRYLCRHEESEEDPS